MPIDNEVVRRVVRLSSISDVPTKEYVVKTTMVQEVSRHGFCNGGKGGKTCCGFCEDVRSTGASVNATGGEVTLQFPSSAQAAVSQVLKKYEAR